MSVSISLKGGFKTMLGGPLGNAEHFPNRHATSGLAMVEYERALRVVSAQIRMADGIAPADVFDNTIGHGAAASSWF